MAKFQADPSSESSSVNGDASPCTPPTPCPQVLGNGAYCGMSMLCTRCVEMRELPDSNSNTKSGHFGQTKSDRPDSKLDAPDPGFETSSCNPSIPCNPPTQQLARCDTCSYFCCICPQNGKPEPNANASAGLFGTATLPVFGAPPSNAPAQGLARCRTCLTFSCTVHKNDKPESSANASTSLFGGPCKTCNGYGCSCSKDKKPDSKSDAPAARCLKDIPISQRIFKVCNKCYGLLCPNATTTVGPPPCPTCRKPDCDGGAYKPGSFLDPHWKPKSDYMPKSRSLFTSGSPNSDGLPRGDNPDSKTLDTTLDALGAAFDDLRAKVEAQHVDEKSSSDHMISKYDTLISQIDEIKDALKLSGV